MVQYSNLDIRVILCKDIRYMKRYEVGHPSMNTVKLDLLLVFWLMRYLMVNMHVSA